MLGVVDVVVVECVVAVARRSGRLEVHLAAAPAVDHHDRGERARARGGQRHVGVERHCVEGGHALGEGFSRAEAHAVLRFARVPERRRFGRGQAWNSQKAATDRKRAQQYPCETTNPHSDPLTRVTRGFNYEFCTWHFCFTHAAASDALPDDLSRNAGPRQGKRDKTWITSINSGLPHKPDITY